jgi:hypothetical protein
VNRIAGRATMCMGRARWARLGLDRACSEGARPRRRAIRGCSIPSDILLSCYEVGSPTVRPCCKD